MNIQTEQLENHVARMVVQFDVERLAEAKKTAAQKMSKQLNIPGFRKGKAPYHIIAKYVGENAIVDDAMEIISNDIYKEALTESGLDPYGPGSVDKYDLEPAPTLTFSVPLQPTVDLKQYRDVRVPVETTQITDQNVERSLKSLLIENAVVEPSQKPAALGDRLTLDIHSHIEPETEGGEEEEFLHEHDGLFLLDAEDDIVPGFSEALVGTVAGDERDFELTLPAEDALYPNRKVSFEVKVKKVENVTLPILNDDFAARVTKDEERPLTLLELRIRIRENLQRMNDEANEESFRNKVLQAIIDQADIRFPEAAVADQIEDMMKRFDQRLREQNKITLRDYLQITRITSDQLYEQYRPSAETSVKRSLVLSEIARQEQLIASDEDVAAEQERMLETFAGNEDALAQARTLFDHPMMQDQVRDNVTRDRVYERIVAIGKGEAPALPDAMPSAEADAEAPSE